MTKNVWDDLLERGFINQSTNDEALKELLARESVTFYTGFDPTADSLHVGHLLPVMAMRRMQKFGHKPIVLVGGATGAIGDPTGRTQARPMMTPETLAHNVASLKKQLSRFICTDEAIFEDNYNWFGSMKYLDFLREMGPRFSVNRMLQMDSVKMRLENTLSFLEFNYMILQAYDFWHLRSTYNCKLQLGGQDQWGNIVAGTELIRRMGSDEAYGLTLPLLLNSAGQKFGKSVAGAVWLDKEKLPVFDYYQFWRNCDDADTGKLLNFFTALPVDETARLAALEPPKINRAKEILAYEATVLAHGEDEAKKAYLTACTKFGFADKEGAIETSSTVKEIRGETIELTDLPTVTLPAASFEGEGYRICQLFADAALCKSNSEARRLIQGGGAYFGDTRIENVNMLVTRADFAGDSFVLKAGKKVIKRIKVA